MPAKAVLDLVESIGSKPLGEVVEGQLRFPLVVRLPEKLRASPEAIGAMLIATPPGERLPLSRLATIEVVEGPSTITREWGQRRITVTANVRGRDMGSFVAEARAEDRRRRCSCRRAAITSSGAASSSIYERARNAAADRRAAGAGC